MTPSFGAHSQYMGQATPHKAAPDVLTDGHKGLTQQTAAHRNQLLSDNWKQGAPPSKASRERIWGQAPHYLRNPQHQGPRDSDLRTIQFAASAHGASDDTDYAKSGIPAHLKGVGEGRKTPFLSK